MYKTDSLFLVSLEKHALKRKELLGKCNHYLDSTPKKTTVNKCFCKFPVRVISNEKRPLLSVLISKTKF